MTVLVVDDDADIRELIVMVAKKEGYATTSATNGAEALQKIRMDLPDIVLLDVMMPVLDGYHTAQAITRDETITKKPLIYFITSRDHHKEGKIMEFSGASGVISKPFNINQIKNLLHEAAGKLHC